jgi:hypothetical protein
MEVTKMTVRVQKELLQRAKQYAKEHDTNLTRLITAYLSQLELTDDILASSPIVKRLSGSLSSDIGRDDHRQYLESKYDRAD